MGSGGEVAEDGVAEGAAAAEEDAELEAGGAGLLRKDPEGGIVARAQ